MLAIGAVSRTKLKLRFSNRVALIAALLPAMRPVGHFDLPALHAWGKWDVEHGVLKKPPDIGRLFDKGGGRRVYKRDPAMSDADCNLDYLMGEQIIAGSPDEVLRRLLLLVEEVGAFGTLVLMSYDWDDKASWVRSMELFARELMPALNKAVGAKG